MTGRLGEAFLELSETSMDLRGSDKRKSSLIDEVRETTSTYPQNRGNGFIGQGRERILQLQNRILEFFVDL